jgi:hypothetical protein
MVFRHTTASSPTSVGCLSVHIELRQASLPWSKPARSAPLDPRSCRRSASPAFAITFPSKRHVLQFALRRGEERLPSPDRRCYSAPPLPASLPAGSPAFPAIGLRVLTSSSTQDSSSASCWNAGPASTFSCTLCSSRSSVYEPVMPRRPVPTTSLIRTPVSRHLLKSRSRRSAPALHRMVTWLTAIFTEHRRSIGRHSSRARDPAPRPPSGSPHPKSKSPEPTFSIVQLSKRMSLHHAAPPAPALDVNPIHRIDSP